jgi:hypothetical protein
MLSGETVKIRARALALSPSKPFDLSRKSFGVTLERGRSCAHSSPPKMSTIPTNVRSVSCGGGGMATFTIESKCAELDSDRKRK